MLIVLCCFEDAFVWQLSYHSRCWCGMTWKPPSPVFPLGIPTRRGGPGKAWFIRFEPFGLLVNFPFQKKESNPPKSCGYTYVAWFGLYMYFSSPMAGFLDFDISSWILLLLVFRISEGFLFDLFGMGPDMQIIRDGWKFKKLADTTNRNYLLQSTFFIVLGWNDIICNSGRTSVLILGFSYTW